MKAKSKKMCDLLIGGVLLVGIILCLMRIYAVNRRYPAPKIEKIQAGATTEVEKDLFMTINKADHLTTKDLQDRYGDEFDADGADCLIVNITVENRGKDARELSLFSWYLESDSHYNNGISMDLFTLCNEDTGENTIPANGKVTVNLPYELYSFHFSKTDWKNIDKIPFYLVKDRYPVKQCWYIPVGKNSQEISKKSA